MAAKVEIRDRVKELRRVRAGDLIANKGNWRKHPKRQRDAMRGVLEEIGYADALLVRETPDGLLLIDGHLRRETTPDMIVPVLVLDVTEEESKTLLATLDPLAGMAEMDTDLFGALLHEVTVSNSAIDQMLADLAADAGLYQGDHAGEDTEPQIDRAAELQQQWGTATGQMWQCGPHRVICGDCTDRAVVERVMGGEKAGMVFTDPPYGHNNNDGDLIHRWEAALGKPKAASSAARPIANDGPEANDLVRKMFSIVSDLLVPGGCCCCCCGGGGGPDPQFARWSLWLDECIPFKMCVVWDKGGLGMGWHYRRNWECILVAEKPGAACKWYGGNDVPNVIRDIGKIIPSKDQHPTEKPVALAEWFLNLHSLPGDLVFDPFLGSGTTMIACHNLGRVCRGIEISPGYVGVILQRYLDATSERPMLVEG
jgi:hypothetical protein